MHHAKGPAEEAEIDPEGEVVHGFLVAWATATRRFKNWQERSNYGPGVDVPLDRARFDLVRTLVNEGSASLTDLAHHVGLTPSHTSRLVESLVQMGMVGRTVPESDRRVTFLAATDRGREVCGAIERHTRHLIAERLGCFLPEEAAQFSSYLQRFAAEVRRWELDEAGHRPTPAATGSSASTPTDKENQT